MKKLQKWFGCYKPGEYKENTICLVQFDDGNIRYLEYADGMDLEEENNVDVKEKELLCMKLESEGWLPMTYEEMLDFMDIDYEEINLETFVKRSYFHKIFKKVEKEISPSLKYKLTNFGYILDDISEYKSLSKIGVEYIVEKLRDDYERMKRNCENFLRRLVVSTIKSSPESKKIISSGKDLIINDIDVVPMDCHQYSLLLNLWKDSFENVYELVEEEDFTSMFYDNMMEIYGIAVTFELKEIIKMKIRRVEIDAYLEKFRRWESKGFPIIFEDEEDFTETDRKRTSKHEVLTERESKRPRKDDQGDVEMESL